MVYFDNAATTFPKPGRVVRAVRTAMERYGANPGRSGHKLAMETAVKVYECRESVAELFHAQVDEVIFTSNCSHALNIAIHGILRQGDHVILSDLEHNSVLRPVHSRAQSGMITYSVAEATEDAEETVRNFAKLITPRTKLIACTHGSNVFGIRLPIQELGRLAAEHNIYFLVDAAQTAGVLDIDVVECQIDFLCAAGHKSLFGPSGTGLLITHRGRELEPLMQGGTGTYSADYGMPEETPERLECGTVNTAGIIGLGAGVSFVKEKGVETLHRHEMRIAKGIYDGLRQIPGVILYTDGFDENRHLPVISFNVDGMISEELTDRLSRKGFGLRGGLHCSPLAHKKMGTMDTGAARISVGPFNTAEEGRRLCDVVRGLHRE